MTELTKKQINAINRIISRTERRYSAADDVYSGQVVTEKGVVVSDGYVTIYYPEALDLKYNTRMPQKTTDNLFVKRDELLDAKMYAVNEPFDMRLCDHPQTWLKNNFLDAKTVQCQNGVGIDLTARYGNWSEDYISGRFILKDITDAVEAVGKNAICYLLRSGNGIPFMMVLPFTDGQTVTDEVMAIVTSVRTR